MKINFKRVLINDLEAFNLIEKWDNNDKIKYFIRPNLTEAEIKFFSAQDLMNGFKEHKNFYLYLIMCDEKEVGYVSVDLDFDHLYSKLPNTGWISICVGESDYRSMGLGESAIKFIENKSRELNCKRIELGVFKFNEKACKFYNRLGYKKIAELENFTFYNGEWQSDIRMEKIL